MERRDRERVAVHRLLSVVGRHGAAIARTLEQKISDAGPFNQRIDPHILIPVRNQLVDSGQLIRVRAHNRDWYALPDSDKAEVEARIAAQFNILRLTLDNTFSHRIGETLEIAVFRALRTSGILSMGGFRALTEEPTTKKQRKEEPPSIFRGQELQGNKRFDFLVGYGDVWAGIECKNIREWLYPDRDEIKHMLGKAVELNFPAILIGRRIPYVTRRLLKPAGIILWETLNQFYPAEYDNLAAQMREKTALGYFDIRVTDHPSLLLTDFITRIIPEELPTAVERFKSYKDLLAAYAFGNMNYNEFAARVRRREAGQNEDKDEEDLSAG